MQWQQREYSDSWRLLPNFEFITDGSLPTHNRLTTHPPSTLLDIPTQIGQETLRLANRSEDVCLAWDTPMPMKNLSCPD